MFPCWLTLVHDAYVFPERSPVRSFSVRAPGRTPWFIRAFPLWTFSSCVSPRVLSVFLTRFPMRLPMHFLASSHFLHGFSKPTSYFPSCVPWGNLGCFPMRFTVHLRFRFDYVRLAFSSLATTYVPFCVPKRPPWESPCPSSSLYSPACSRELFFFLLAFPGLSPNPGLTVHPGLTLGKNTTRGRHHPLGTRSCLPRGRSGSRDVRQFIPRHLCSGVCFLKKSHKPLRGNCRPQANTIFESELFI